MARKVKSLQKEALKNNEKKNIALEIEKIATIVDDGLKNEKYTEINDKLWNCISHSKKDEKYIFEYYHIGSSIIGAIFGTILLAVSLYLFFIATGTVMLSEQYFLYGMIGSIAVLVFIVVNIIFICRYISNYKFKRRYEKYYNILRFRSFEIIENIAICTKQKKRKVIKDLKRAVKNKLIPQGHFSKGNIVFFVSEKIYNLYLNKMVIYDWHFEQYLEERDISKEETAEIKVIMETGAKYIENLNDNKKKIKNRTMLKNIAMAEKTVLTVLYEIDLNPNRFTYFEAFLNNYLLSTRKLLDAYMAISEKKNAGYYLNNINKELKKELVSSVDAIIIVFDKILEQIYTEQEKDVILDIEAQSQL